ncbi:MAG TPA: response regulator transcription factor [Bacteroidales bacterium]|nr:response regulator transcription factor [Bacteroidales bacterium]
MKIKVAIVDDHKLVTDCLGLLLASSPNMEIVGIAHNGNDILSMLDRIMVDVIILDINMPGMTGIEATEKIKKNHAGVKVVVLSMHSDYENISKAIDAGADGYLPKDVASEELLEAITTVNGGKNYFHTKISDEIIRNYSIKKKKTISPFPQLTRRELEVLHLFAKGFNNNEIADKLFLSVRTIESHKNHILQKTNMKNSVELIKFAIKYNIVEL